MGRSAYSREGWWGCAQTAARRCWTSLLEAVADEGAVPFPAHVLAAMRRVGRCEAVFLLRLESGGATGALPCRRRAGDDLCGAGPAHPPGTHDHPLPPRARNGHPL